MPIAKGRLNAQGFALELEGVNQGFVQSFEGGWGVGNVVVEKMDVDHIVHKHIAGVKYEDITVTVGSGMGKEFYEFVKATFNQQPIGKQLAFKRADSNQNVTWEMDAYNTLMTAVEFPPLDAAAKGVGELTIKFSPDYTRVKQGSGKLSQARRSKPKQWNTSNFRLTIPGLDCTRVSKIGALSLTMDVVSEQVGEHRYPEKHPGPLHVPNLVVTLSEQAAQSFVDWHESFVIAGKNMQDQEKEGTLELLAADLKEVLFTLKFHSLGIFRLAADKYEAGNEAVNTLTAEMYCETMEFDYGPGVVG